MFLLSWQIMICIDRSRQRRRAEWLLSQLKVIKGNIYIYLEFFSKCLKSEKWTLSTVYGLLPRNVGAKVVKNGGKKKFKGGSGTIYKLIPLDQSVPQLQVLTSQIGVAFDDGSACWTAGATFAAEDGRASLLPPHSLTLSSARIACTAIQSPHSLISSSDR